jgi:hypothetical protein
MCYVLMNLYAWGACQGFMSGTLNGCENIVGNVTFYSPIDLKSKPSAGRLVRRSSEWSQPVGGSTQAPQPSP